MADGMWTAIGTAVGTYFGAPQVGTAVGAALDGSENRQKADDQRGDRYQVAVKDMMAAGLNPMLAYSQGGAPTNASTSSPDVGGHISASNAQQLQREFQQPQIENIKAQTVNTQASTAEAVSRTQNNLLQADLIRAQVESERRRPGNIEADTTSKGYSQDLTKAQERKVMQDLDFARLRYPEEFKKLVEEVRGAMWTNNASELDVSRRESESAFWSSETGKMKPYVDAIMPGVNSAISLGRARFGR